MYDNSIQSRLRCLVFLNFLCIFAVVALGLDQRCNAFAQSNPYEQDASQAKTAAELRVDFRNDVLPIFQQRCLECHSDENIEGNLNLLSHDSIAEGGFSGRPIIGNSLGESELYQRIISKNEDDRMPRSDSELSRDEIDVIGNWILQGGSFERPKKVQLEPSINDRLVQLWVTAEKLWKRKPIRYAAIFSRTSLHVLGFSHLDRDRQNAKKTNRCAV